jgi:hypothetical protein
MELASNVMHQIGRLRGAIAGLTLAMWLWGGGAEAMQFSTIPLDGNPGAVFIGAVGEIIPGDMDRLRAHIGGLPATARVLGFALDCPGGDVVEAEHIANGIRRLQVNVIVLGKAKCASACFLIFAAGTKRFFEVTALIGVHSVSEAGRETAQSMALTTAMARDAAELGVPAGIIGKMVTAQPGQMEWLTQRDLVSMGVQIIQPDAPAAPTLSSTVPPTGPAQGSAASVAPPPVAVHEPVAAQESVTFRQGFADRQGWETWFASLSGTYLGGASFWAEHRSDPRTPSCYGAAGLDLGAFTAGCQSAQQRLSPTDARRKGDPEYRRGWNSY